MKGMANKAKKQSWLPTIVAAVFVLGAIGSFLPDSEEDANPDEPQTAVEETVRQEEPEEPVLQEPLDADEAEPAPEEPVQESKNEDIPEPPAETTDPTSAAPAPTNETAEPTPAAAAEAPAEAQPKSPTVYVTKSGKHYHSSRNCNGAEYFESDLDTALRQGLTPCKKCVG